MTERWATATLYEQLGGAGAVEVVVTGFHERLTSDPAVGHLFPVDRRPQVLARQIAYVTALLGGPNDGESVGLVAAHADVPADAALVDLLVGHLRAGLADADVAPDLADKVVALVTRVWLARLW